MTGPIRAAYITDPGCPFAYGGEALVSALLARIDDPDVEDAYQRDRVESRSAVGSPSEAQGKARDGRYTAPTLIFEK